MAKITAPKIKRILLMLRNSPRTEDKSPLAKNGPENLTTVGAIAAAEKPKSEITEIRLANMP